MTAPAATPTVGRMLRVTRHGFKEMLIGSVVLAAVAVGAGLGPWYWWPLAALAIVVLLWLFAFFRDPERVVPAEERVMVSPADGTVSDITEVEHDELLGGPALRIGIFLSVFNVHVNRSPCDGRVLSISYRKGKFLNALNHAKASEENESNTVVLGEPTDRPAGRGRQADRRPDRPADHLHRLAWATCCGAAAGSA